jgi:hypothetical protein
VARFQLVARRQVEILAFDAIEVEQLVGVGEWRRFVSPFGFGFGLRFHTWTWWWTMMDTWEEVVGVLWSWLSCSVACSLLRGLSSLL